MSETVPCPLCEGEISLTARKCRHCGEWVSRDCLGCGTPIKSEWAARGYCADCEGKKGKGKALQEFSAPMHVAHYQGEKNRGAAVALALLLGGLGAHKFYLGKPWMGLFYLIFFWAIIPSIVGFVEGILYATMTEEEFQRKYSGRGTPDEYSDLF